MPGRCCDARTPSLWSEGRPGRRRARPPAGGPSGGSGRGLRDGRRALGGAGRRARLGEYAAREEVVRLEPHEVILGHRGGLLGQDPARVPSPGPPPRLPPAPLVAEPFLPPP